MTNPHTTPPVAPNRGHQPAQTGWFNNPAFQDALEANTCPICGDPDTGLHFHPSPKRAATYTDHLPGGDTT